MRLLVVAVVVAVAVPNMIACATVAPASKNGAPSSKASKPSGKPSSSSSSRRPPSPPTEPAREPTNDEEPSSTQARAGSRDDDDAPLETGLASYYADELAGHRTASGEKYLPEAATCAHRSYAFGTVLDVTAVDSGRTTTCRVNDRGPWVEDRVLDVSKKVARELGMLGPGVVRVTVRKHED